MHVKFSFAESFKFFQRQIHSFCLSRSSQNLHSVANIPEVFQNYLVKVSDIHLCNTRYASNLNFHVPRVRSNYMVNTHLGLP